MEDFHLGEKIRAPGKQRQTVCDTWQANRIHAPHSQNILLFPLPLSQTDCDKQCIKF